ncbi:MAG: hypothetical protein US75_C0050G0002 [Candidatus Woesebacteria bacterium GW2011_GWC1_38_13]|uniref:Uncharacterized protein n=1 Tax=Candidatus Woesebacteria bacterium GW2011_GWC1_38_13 TaxID=1618583 RepID=A0A0G0IRW8_9BACT|nr:MAG: hypothetical protein US75_C0050G0002 [Candidatus Woesebacteria bacterium GW2011_GWC1_38_13]
MGVLILGISSVVVGEGVTVNEGVTDNPVDESGVTDGSDEGVTDESGVTDGSDEGVTDESGVFVGTDVSVFGTDVSVGGNVFVISDVFVMLGNVPVQSGLLLSADTKVGILATIIPPIVVPITLRASLRVICVKDLFSFVIIIFGYNELIANSIL